MVGMATLGTAEYNGYVFEGATKCKMRSDFEYDTAGRNVSHHKNILRLEGYIASAAGTTDAEFAALRARLSKVGKPFRFVSKGFGDDLVVNYPGGALNDVANGPKPRFLEWNPIAGQCAAEFVWEIEVCVPVCDGSGFHRTSGVMAFCYDIDFQIDRGWTTRTISGSLQIAMTRLPSFAGAPAQIPDHADRYREAVRAGDIAPDGFERTSSWSTSEDKRTLSFSITDTQIRSRYPRPPGVVEIDCDEEVDWRRANKQMGEQACQLDMQIEMELSRRPELGFYIFSQLLAQRLQVPRANDKSVMLQSMSIRNSVWGMGQKYSASWIVFAKIDDIVRGTGVFMPPNNIAATNWSSWNASVQATQSQRGYLKMADSAFSDIIVDLCTNILPQVPQQPNAPPRPANPGRAQVYQNPKPTPDKSYLGYEMWVEVQREMPVTRQSPQQAPSNNPYQNSPGIPPGYQHPDTTTTSPNGTGGMGFNPSQKAQYDDTFSFSGGGKHKLTLKGTARRAGYEISQPKIISCGDMTVEAGTMIEAGVRFTQKVEDVYFGLPVYIAAWEITYLLANAPNRVETRPKIDEGGSGPVAW